MDEIVARFGANNANRLWYYQDGRGNTSHVADDTGALVETYTYDLGGKPFITTAIGKTSPKNRFLYNGRDYSSFTGLYDFRNRLYQPATSRFIQSDPIGFAGGNHLYRFAGNSAVNAGDPLGLEPPVSNSNCAYFCAPDVQPTGGATVTAEPVTVTGSPVDSNGVPFQDNSVATIGNTPFENGPPNPAITDFVHGTSTPGVGEMERVTIGPPGNGNGSGNSNGNSTSPGGPGNTPGTNGITLGAPGVDPTGVVGGGGGGSGESIGSLFDSRWFGQKFVAGNRARRREIAGDLAFANAAEKFALGESVVVAAPVAGYFGLMGWNTYLVNPPFWNTAAGAAVAGIAGYDNPSQVPQNKAEWVGQGIVWTWDGVEWVAKRPPGK